MRFFLIALCAFVSACSFVDVPQPGLDKPFAKVPVDARPSPFRLSQLKHSLPLGSKVAASSPRDLGVFCRGPYDYIPRSQVVKAIETSEMKLGFYDVMSALGYDVSDNPNIDFDADDDVLRSIYTISADIEDVQLDVCRQSSLIFGLDQGYEGEAYVRVRWSVYDRLQRKTVLRTQSEGYYRADTPSHEGIELLLVEAFMAASHNLGAQEIFYKLMVEGRADQDSFVRDEAYEGLYQSDEAVDLPELPLATEALNDAKMLQQNAVLILSGGGHGSGFFITEQGHILTNQHVVGNADRVRIETHGKKQKLMAEVLRRDKVRDVALLRVVDMPEGFVPTLRPVRTMWPAIGEDVFAVGAPRLNKDLQDTVTKGIVSAHRKKNRFDQNSYLQSDVTIHAGNSGGPLYDRFGNIIAITVSGYDFSGIGLNTGLNNFIPIGEALEVLEIE